VITMPKKNIYLRNADTPVWDAAERVAKRNDTSVSRLIVEALTEHLPKAAAKPVRQVSWADLGTDTSAA
jgi:hypothetical protein